MKRMWSAFLASSYPYHLLMPAVAAASILLATSLAGAQGLKHRYSFNEGEAADATGRTITDSVGGAHGRVEGTGASATADQLIIPGGDQATAAYVDLPNGIISSLTNATFEAWYTMNGATAWTRVFDFGSRETVGEVLPGAGNPAGAGMDYIFYAPTRENPGNPQLQRVGMRNNDAAPAGNPGTVAGGEDPVMDSSLPYVPGETGEWHVAVVLDSTGGTMTEPVAVSWYINGVPVPGVGAGNPANTAIQLGHLNDVNNWLGRSNWAGDQNLNGSFNEFRIYDTALNAQQVATSFGLGPDRVIPEPTTILLVAAAGAGCLLAVRRRRWAR